MPQLVLRWSDPRLAELLRLLTEAYPTGRRAMVVAEAVEGFPIGNVAWDDPDGAESVWRSALTVAAKASLLVETLERVLADATVRAYHEGIQTLFDDIKSAQAEPSDVPRKHTSATAPPRSDLADVVIIQTPLTAKSRHVEGLVFESSNVAHMLGDPNIKATELRLALRRLLTELTETTRQDSPALALKLPALNAARVARRQGERLLGELRSATSGDELGRPEVIPPTRYRLRASLNDLLEIIRADVQHADCD